jgi:hypothetical protein
MSKTEQLVGQLAAGVDVERVLDDLRLTATQALNLLRTRGGRRIIAARRRLAEIHADIVACRYSAFAVHRICETMQSDKPELRLKGATSLLGIAKLGRKSAKKKSKNAVHEPTAEDLKLLEILARAMNPALPEAESAEDDQNNVDNVEDPK